MEQRVSEGRGEIEEGCGRKEETGEREGQVGEHSVVWLLHMLPIELCPYTMMNNTSLAWTVSVCTKWRQWNELSMHLSLMCSKLNVDNVSVTTYLHVRMCIMPVYCLGVNVLSCVS